METFEVSRPGSGRKAMSPRAARSTMAEVNWRAVERPAMSSVAPAGERPGGGAGMSTEGSSVYCGSRPTRYQRRARKPSRPSAAIGATMSPSDGIADAGGLQLPDVVGGDLGIDRVEGSQQRLVEVALAQVGQHDALEDGLALVRAEIGRLEAGTRLEAHGAVLAALVQVEDDDQAVVEPGPTRRPTDCPSA